MGQPLQKRLLAPVGMMEPFHREQFALDSIVGLIEQGAGDRHLRVFKHHIPPRFLLLNPAPHARAIGGPRRGRGVIGKMAQPLAQRKYTQALALSGPVQESVKP